MSSSGRGLLLPLLLTALFLLSASLLTLTFWPSSSPTSPVAFTSELPALPQTLRERFSPPYEGGVSETASAVEDGVVIYAGSNSVAQTNPGSVLGVSTSSFPNLHTELTYPSSFVINLNTDGTYFKVQDHGVDVLRVDYDKNVTLMPGSTLHLLGKLKDAQGSLGQLGQVLTAQGANAPPLWTNQVNLIAGDLQCEDCLTSKEIATLEDLSVSGVTTFNSVAYSWPSSDGSNQQFLQTNGEGSLAWSTLSGGNLSDFNISSPSSGQILIYDGTDSWDNKSVSGDATLAANGALTVSSVTCTDCLNATEIEDIYLLNSGDTATGDYNFASNTLFVDSVNNRVGVGTGTPNGLLYVDNIGFDNGIHFVGINARNDAILTIEGTGSLGGAGNRDQGLLINIATQNGSQQLLHIKDNDTSRFVVEGSGNVGIGPDTSPDYLLDVQGTLHADGDTTIDGNVGIGDTSPASLFTVGNGDLFQVNSSGDIVKIKNLTYAWPSAHTTDGVLTNNGTGTLSWATIGASGITADSLDFSEFKDQLELDASTDILADNAEVFSLTNTGSGNSLVVNDEASDTTPFVIDASGNVGVGTGSPGAMLEIETGAAATKGLIVQGAASQSANLQEWQNSAGSNLVSILNDGAFRATIEAQFGSGSDPHIGNPYGIKVRGLGIAVNGTSIFNNNVGIGDTSPSALLTIGNGDLVTINSTGQVNAGTSGDGLVTKVVAGACDDSAFTTDTDGLICLDSSNGRIYFRYGGAWHYSAQTAGFQIPNLVWKGKNETEGLKVGDYVIGRLDQKLSDGALHGIYVNLNEVLDERIAAALAKLTTPSGSPSLEGESQNFLPSGEGRPGGVLTLESLVVKEALSVHGNLNILGTLSLSKQQGGYAEIPTGGREVRVTFTKKFATTPLVNASPRGVPGSLWGVVDDNSEGFTLRLNQVADETIKFTWTAWPVTDSQTSRGEVAGEVSEPVEEITEEVAEEESKESETPAPTITPSPSVSPPYEGGVAEAASAVEDGVVNSPPSASPTSVVE
jgi:hypothetical protein